MRCNRGCNSFRWKRTMFQARSKSFLRKDEGYSRTTTPTLISCFHYRRFPLSLSSTDTTFPLTTSTLCCLFSHLSHSLSLSLSPLLSLFISPSLSLLSSNFIRFTFTGRSFTDKTWDLLYIDFCTCVCREFPYYKRLRLRILLLSWFKEVMVKKQVVNHRWVY